LRYATARLLAPHTLHDTERIAAGDFTVRYGVRFVDKPNLSIVPGLLALDYGEMLTGDKMWDFMTSHYNQYPRADVLGYRNDGQDEMIPLKKLDFAQPLDVLIYQTPQATVPIAPAHALIIPTDQTVPARLTDALPTYQALADWINRE